MTKLLCLDFDETCTKISYFKYLRFTSNVPGRQAERAQTSDDIIKIKEIVKDLLANPQTGIKNADELEKLIKDALTHGDCVAITSYNDYPEAIELLLIKLNLQPAEIARIYLANHLPCYGPQGERLSYGQAVFDDSQGKEVHIREALEHFQQQGNEIEFIVLVDDNEASITQVNQLQYSIKNIPIFGVLVEKAEEDISSYIVTTRELLKLHHDAMPNMLGFSLLDLVHKVITKFDTTKPPSRAEQNLLLIEDKSKLSQKLSEYQTTAKRLFEQREYVQAENSYMQAIKLAIRVDNKERLKDLLIQLGDLLREKYLAMTTKPENHQLLIKVIALYNKALCFCNTEQERKNLTAKIIEVTNYILHLIVPQKEIGITLEEVEQHKINLQSIRRSAGTQLQVIIKGEISTCNWWEQEANIQAIQKLQETLTNDMKQFICSLFKECFTILGEPPCAFAIITFGSTAREEMTPYSDFEWGILLDNDAEANKYYFRNLTNLLQLKVINLGETTLRTMGMDVDDYNIGNKGFSFDGLMSYACKWPLGRADGYDSTGKLIKGFELIGTPEAILKYLTAPGYEPTLHFPATLSCVAGLTTDNVRENLELVKRYKVALWAQLRQPLTSQLTFGQQQAIKNWQDDILKFPLDIKQIEDAGKIYDVKKDLYRLPNTLLDGLGLYYRLTANSGWNKIYELYDKGIIDQNSLKHLKRLISMVTALRLHTYLTRSNQRELLTRYPEYLAIISEIYKTIVPFVERIKSLIDAPNSPALLNATLYDDSDLMKGKIYYRLMHYKEAFQCIVKVLITSISHEEQIYYVWNTLGLMLFKAGEDYLSFNIYSYVFTIISKYADKIPIDLAKILHNLANVYYTLGKYNIALKYFKKVVKIYDDAGDQVNKARALDTIGVIYSDLGQFLKAKEHLKFVLSIKKEYYGSRQSVDVAMTLNSLATIHIKLAEYKEAEKLLFEALEIKEKHYRSREHIEVITTLYNIAIVYGYLAKYEEARKSLEEIIMIQEKYYNTRECIEVAKTLNTLGNTYMKLGENEKARRSIEEALTTARKYYQGKQHINIAKMLVNLGNIYQELGNFSQAERLLKEALAIEQKHYGSRHIEVAKTLHNIAALLVARVKISPNSIVDDYNQAREFLREALAIKQEYYGTRRHIEVVNILQLLAAINQKLGDFNQAPGAIKREHNLILDSGDINSCYYIERPLLRVGFTQEHIERAINFPATSELYCEYGHFLYVQAKKTKTLERKKLFTKAIIPLTKAISAGDNNKLSYIISDFSRIDDELQELLNTHKNLSIYASCLAYYLLIKIYFELEDYSMVEQKLIKFEEKLAYLSSLSREAMGQLTIEISLFEEVRQLFAACRLSLQQKETTATAIRYTSRW